MNKFNTELYNYMYVNSLFFNMIENKKNNNISIKDFYNDFLNNFGISDYNFWNQGSIFMSLYGLFVVPKEFWDENQKDFPFNTRDRFIGEEDISKEAFLRKLRNSISHSNFEFNLSVEGEIVFWNINKGTKNFQVKSNPIGITAFLNECIKYYKGKIK